MKGLIERTLKPLMDERGKLDDERRTLEEELSDKKDELKRVERILIDGGLIEREPKATPKAKSNEHLPARVRRDGRTG